MGMFSALYPGWVGDMIQKKKNHITIHDMYHNIYLKTIINHNIRTQKGVL